MDHKHIEKFRLKLPKTEEDVVDALQKINCPSCGTPASSDNINIQDKIAKCDPCDGVFSFASKIQATEKISPVPVKTRTKANHPISQPVGVVMFREDDALEMDLTTGLGGGLISTLFLFPIYALLAFGAYADNGGAFLKWIIILLSFIGVFLIWNLFPYKRKVHLVVADKMLSLEWDPSLFKKTKQYSTEDISQVYVKKPTGTSKPSIYIVVDGDKGQRHVKLIDHIKTLSQAKFIEQEIEDYLGITDSSIMEEYKS